LGRKSLLKEEYWDWLQQYSGSFPLGASKTDIKKLTVGILFDHMLISKMVNNGLGVPL